MSEAIKIKLNSTLIKILDEKYGIDPFSEYKPAYGGESVGLDLYYAGNTTLTLQGRYDKTKNQNDKVLIPTGVHIALPLGYVALVKDRGSISKTNVVRRAGVVDPGYTGEIFVNLAVLYGEKCVINPGDKLPVQLVVVKAETNYEVVDEDEYSQITNRSQRGHGAVGSSDQ